MSPLNPISLTRLLPHLPLSLLNIPITPNTNPISTRSRLRNRPQKLLCHRNSHIRTTIHTRLIHRLRNPFRQLIPFICPCEPSVCQHHDSVVVFAAKDTAETLGCCALGI